jgi:uncharacterized membrane protein YfcA
VISACDALFLLGAGVLAGVVGTAGGISSLISYPALLSVGLTALPASVTNIVALVVCWPGSALASQPELVGRKSWLRRWAVVAASGGVVGSGLLLSTPPGVFSRVVPYLLAFAAACLLLQPRLSMWWQRRRLPGDRLLLPFGLFAASVYNGYFGAGAGIMVLALVLLTVDQHVAEANALKNMLVGMATFASAVTLVGLGHVDWAAAAPLAIGSFVGSMVGPWVARRIPDGVLRWLVAMTGLGLAIRLWIVPA